MHRLSKIFLEELHYYFTIIVKNYTKNTTIIFTNDNFDKKKKKPRISPLEHSILVCLKTV